MKRCFLFSVSIAFLCVSCVKDLDQNPISAATTQTFYTSANDFIQGINAVYGNLKTYPTRMLNLSETRSDNLYAVSVGGVRDWEGINSFHKTISSNPYISEAWSADFNGIYQANVLLDQLAQKGEVIPSADLRTRLEAEAKFLRAFYYFDLVRWFGKAPVVDRSLTAAEALTMQRRPVSEVYDLIMSDLAFAGEYLPEEYTDADRGRATRYAAKGLLALVHMTRSGPAYGIEGPGMAVDEWSRALTLLNEIISSGKYTFLPDYKDVFSYTNENNAEVIFDIQYISEANPELGSDFPALLVPNTYFQSLGEVVPGSSNLRPVSNDLLDLYEEGDTRKSFTIHTGYIFNGEPETRSFFKKYLDINRIPDNFEDWPVNFIVLRYTDVLLMKAECVLHGAAGSQENDVDAVVNQVRARGGLTDPRSNITLQELMNERRKEFAAEGSRWHDLVRSGLIETTMSSWIAEEDVLNQIQPFQTNYIIYPIPQSELDVREGLYTQNPGY